MTEKQALERMKKHYPGKSISVTRKAWFHPDLDPPHHEYTYFHVSVVHEHKCDSGESSTYEGAITNCLKGTKVPHEDLTHA